MPSTFEQVTIFATFPIPSTKNYFQSRTNQISPVRLLFLEPNLYLRDYIQFFTTWISLFANKHRYFAYSILGRFLSTKNHKT